MLNKLTKIKRLLLIGKEIWHNKRSMRGRFIIYLLSLVLLAGSAMLILLNVIGIVQPPSHDIDRFLEYELNTRTNDIKRQMNALAAHNIDLSQQLQNDIDRVMLEQGIYNNYDALNNNPEALTAIQQATYQTLAAKMQQAPASGALYLINASVNTNLLEPTYNGLFLKFTNIYSENTLFNEKGAAAVYRTDAQRRALTHQSKQKASGEFTRRRLLLFRGYYYNINFIAHIIAHFYYIYSHTHC